MLLWLLRGRVGVIVWRLMELLCGLRDLPRHYRKLHHLFLLSSSLRHLQFITNLYSQSEPALWEVEIILGELSSIDRYKSATI
jgi:hypothetical protein